jgi:ferric-dicitrate binding protein FerR (iron transport regulator)
MQTRETSVERVVLDGGWVRIHVRPQREEERFLVALPDGELEVRGTTFDVTVEEGATTSVHVDEGVVELRLASQTPARLAAGDTWLVRSPPRQAKAVAGKSATAPEPGQHAGREEIEAYKAAMALLLDGHGTEASAAFEAFVTKYPHAPQAEDASYLRAVGLARVGRTQAAAEAAEQHLERFPGSFHRREAAILIAQAASARGDCARADGSRRLDGCGERQGSSAGLARVPGQVTGRKTTGRA